jgi:hypothetical protein
LDSTQISLWLLTAGLGAAAALIWFGAVYRSAYKAVAPVMRIYPRVIDLFAALSILGFVAATTIVMLDLAMARGDGDHSYMSQTDPSWIFAKYLLTMIEPAVILAMIFALILRWSIAAALAVTVAAAIIAGLGIWIAVIVVDNLITSQSKELFGLGITAVAGLASLFVPLWIARSRRNSKARRVFVALCIPMAVLAVGALEVCVMVAVDYLIRNGHIAGYEVFPFLGPKQKYGPHYFFIIHAIMALLFVQWIYVRWARLSLRPE